MSMLEIYPNEAHGSAEDNYLSLYVRQRREQLGITPEEAAAAAGLSSSEWCALEMGWVPESPAVLTSIAGVLQVSFLRLSAVASVTLYRRQDRAG